MTPRDERLSKRETFSVLPPYYATLYKISRPSSSSDRGSGCFNRIVISLGVLVNGPRRREAAWRHSPASVRSYLSGCRLCRLPPLVPRLAPHSSSASRFTAGAAGFLILSQ